MRPRKQRRGRHDALVPFAFAALLVIGLGGCATTSTLSPGSPPTNATYVGLFTGELVDGKPLYRFPAIQVVGWRSRVVDD